VSFGFPDLTALEADYFLNQGSGSVFLSGLFVA
jgi:hypothetical protein